MSTSEQAGEALPAPRMVEIPWEGVEGYRGLVEAWEEGYAAGTANDAEANPYLVELGQLVLDRLS